MRWAFLLCFVGFVFADDDNRGPPIPKNNGTNCSCGWSNKEQGLLSFLGIGPKKEQFPSSVAIVESRKTKKGWARTVVCGGIIISPNHILTAAHCTDNAATDSKFKLGALIGGREHTLKYSHRHHRDRDDRDHHHHHHHDGLLMDTPKFFISPNYNMTNRFSDIAILELNDTLKFNGKVGPVCLPQPGLDVTGLDMKILGYDVDYDSDSLTYTPKTFDVETITRVTCSDEYVSYFPQTTTTKLCTVLTSNCESSSGSPALWLDSSINRYTLAGLVSFGEECDSSYPTVHTRVEAFVDWIQQTIAESKPTLTCQRPN